MANRDNIDAIVSQNNIIKYPDPFFDLSRNYFPTNIKKLFKWCRTYFYTNEFIRNVITKLTEYPITDIIFSNEVPNTLESNYKKFFDRDLKLKKLLIEIGLDYYTYGNSFVSSQLVFKRSLKCPNCGHLESIELVSYKFKNYNFVGTCSKCNKTDLVFTPIDIPIQNREGLIFTRWSPENIEIVYNHINGKSIYYYVIPSNIRKFIIAGNKDIISTMPMPFIEAVKTGKKVKLDSENLYHFKRPTLAEDDMGWGKPIILPALKKLYYMQTLLRANEAIAAEHIVPKKAVFPSPNNTFDMHTMGMGTWKGQVEKQIKMWKVDPNHIATMPIPIGYQELGGNARALMLTQELRFLEETIINGLGVPLEFIKGGASWTGSSVSLRIIENHFLNYRELIEDFLNYFLIEKIHLFLKWDKVTVRLQKLKMSDDAETKRLALQLNVNDKISNDTLLSEFGFDSEEEAAKVDREQETVYNRLIKSSVANADAQGEAMVKQGIYQTRTQHAMREEAAKLEEEKIKKELAEELNSNSIEDVHNDLNSLVLLLSTMDEEKQNESLESLRNSKPHVFVALKNRMVQKMNLSPTAADQENQQEQKAQDQQFELQKQTVKEPAKPKDAKTAKEPIKSGHPMKNADTPKKAPKSTRN